MRTAPRAYAHVKGPGLTQFFLSIYDSFQYVFMCVNSQLEVHAREVQSSFRANMSHIASVLRGRARQRRRDVRGVGLLPGPRGAP